MIAPRDYSRRQLRPARDHFWRLFPSVSGSQRSLKQVTHVMLAVQVLREGMTFVCDSSVE